MLYLFDKKVGQEVAKLLLKIKAVSFRFNPPYTFTSGLLSPIYLDNRLVMSYPNVREKIINYYIRAIKKRIGKSNVEWISATASAAIPNGAWVAQKLKLPMVFVRPTTKQYGKGNKIEGYIKKRAKVLIIEDHISTATSVDGNSQSIRDLGGIVKYCVATTTFETKQADVQLKKSKISLIVLTTGRIIVETAYKQGMLTQKEKESVDSWLSNSLEWAKKQP